MADNFSEELLPYYFRELAYLREAGGAFAQQYPKIADRLQIGREPSPDPHVERLLESFAYLTARIQYRLDSEFPEIPAALLGLLYPQFLDPVPSMSVAEIMADPAQGQVVPGAVIERDTQLFAEASKGLACRFRSSYPTTLWPLKVEEAGFLPNDAYGFVDSSKVATLLRLKVGTLGPKLEELPFERLRFYLAGPSNLTHPLFEYLSCNLVELRLLPGGDASASQTGGLVLQGNPVHAVGFGRDEALLPYPRQSHPGYRLLREYFTFPEKFLFLDIEGLGRHGHGRSFELLFMLDRMPAVQVVPRPETFVLNCTPVINLFNRVSEPIRIDQAQLDYRLIPDLLRERTTEIHSIRRVSVSSDPGDATREVASFFSYSHDAQHQGQTAYWYARRQLTERADLPGTEMWLSFRDLDFKPTHPPTDTVYAHLLCTNRDLAIQVPAGALLHREDGNEKARLLMKPTPPISPPLSGALYWRLVSHLALNHLSLTAGPESVRALREILRLYASAGRSNAEQEIAGIVGMRSRKVVRRAGSEAWRGFRSGDQVTLELDESTFVGSCAYLLASVLNRFLPLYGAANSFTRLIARSRTRNQELKRWPPMAGDRIVL
jgi:type VI secretion system protein ImpG